MAIALHTISPKQISEDLEAFLVISRDIPDEYWAAENFLCDLPEKWQLSFAAWLGKSLVGYAILSRKAPARVHLHHFMIAPAHRGHGLGTRMLREMVDRAALSDARILTLKVNVERAEAFYRRNEFYQIGTEGAYLTLARTLPFKRHQSEPTARSIAIHQPNYAPWLGYFYKISRAEVFVFLDDAQYSKGSYTNRVSIGRAGRTAWLTQPVRHSLGQKIKDVQFASGDWPSRHLDTLRGAYERAAAFADVWPDISAIYDSVPSGLLAGANRYIVEALACHLALDCRFAGASDLGLDFLSGGDRLIAIVRALTPNATYLSGRGGEKYQDPAKFKAARIPLSYLEFEDRPYPQGGAAFMPGLSVFDAVFHLGWRGTRALLVAP